MGPIHLRTAQALGSTAWALSISKGCWNYWQCPRANELSHTTRQEPLKREAGRRATQHMPIIFPLVVTIKRQINRQNIGLVSSSKHRASRAQRQSMVSLTFSGKSGRSSGARAPEERGGNARRVMSPIDRLQSSRQNMKKEIKGSKSSRAASAFCLAALARADVSDDVGAPGGAGDIWQEKRASQSAQRTEVAITLTPESKLSLLLDLFLRLSCYP